MNAFFRFLVIYLLAAIQFGIPASAQGAPRASGRDREVWIANAYHHIVSSGDYSKPILMTSVLYAFDDDKSAKKNDVLNLLYRQQKAYGQLVEQAKRGYRIPENTVKVTQSMVRLAGVSPKTNVASKVLSELLTLGQIGYEGFKEFPSKSQANQQLYQEASRIQPYIREILGYVYDGSKTNRNLAETVDEFFFSDFHAKTSDSADEILAQNPAFAENASIKLILDKLADGKFDSKETSETIANHFSRLEEDIQETRRLVKEGNESTAMQIDAVEHQRATEILLTSARPALMFVTVLIGDKETAQRVERTGLAAIQIASAFSEFSKGSAALSGQFGKFGQAIGAAALMGNLLGAVQLLSAVGPDQDQLMQAEILKEVQAMRQQLADFQNETRERFDRIDSQLNTIYSRMLENFDVVIKALHELSGDTQQIKESIIQLAKALDSLEVRLDRKLYDLQRAPYDQALSECLDPSIKVEFRIEQYGSCLDRFSNWATKGSTTDVIAGTSNPGADPQAWIPTLTERAPVQAIRTLAVLAGDQSHPANPLEWAQGVEAYLLFSYRYPQYLPKVNLQRVQQLISTGEQTKSTIRRLVYPSNDRQVFPETLLKSYSQAWIAVANRLMALETDYRSKALANGADIDLWKGSSETTRYSVKAQEAQPCLKTNPDALDLGKLPIWPEYTSPLVPRSAVIAEQLNMGAVEFCYEIFPFPPSQDLVQPFDEYKKGFNPRFRVISLSYRLTATFVPSQEWTDIKRGVVVMRQLDSPNIHIEGTLPKGSIFIWYFGKGEELNTIAKNAWGGPEPAWLYCLMPNVNSKTKGGIAYDKCLLPIAHQQEVEESIDAIEAGVKKGFIKRREGWLSFLQAKFSSDTDLVAAIRSLDGLRVALHSTLGLIAPETSLDDQIRGWFYGPARLPSGEYMKEQLSKDIDVHDFLKQQTSKIGDFSETLSKFLLAAVSEGGGSLPIIDQTLTHLRAHMDVVCRASQTTTSPCHEN